MRTHHAELFEVLDHASVEDKKAWLCVAFREDVGDAGPSELNGLIISEMEAAASHTLTPWRKPPSYREIVIAVAERVKLSPAADAPAGEVEQMVLHQVIEQSIKKMSDGDKQAMCRRIEEELKERGHRVAVDKGDLLGLAQTLVLDIGGVGGGALLGLGGAATGIGGAVGLNVLQAIVLKAIFATSGYLAAGGALLGLGAGGAAMGAAGMAGPIGVGVAAAIGAWKLGSPAYRKLIPFVCQVGAARIQQGAG